MGTHLCKHTNDIPAPANDAIKYEIHNEHATDHHVYSIYSGPPTAESVEAWNHIIERKRLTQSDSVLLAILTSVISDIHPYIP